ncbi:hypothetical protein CVS40_7331 [Lucilia cuprina]|nr:hypothetical protein CVS40_7331 [Lucilia cuprina]
MSTSEEDFSTLPSNVGQMEISRVAVKALPFWRSDPLLLLKQIESQFIMSGITQDATKFHTIVASIESNILEKVQDIILNPPSSNMYEALKSKQIKPSDLLSQMCSLTQNRVFDEILKQLWMQRLPSQI